MVHGFQHTMFDYQKVRKKKTENTHGKMWQSTLMQTQNCLKHVENTTAISSGVCHLMRPFEPGDSKDSVSQEVQQFGIDGVNCNVSSYGFGICNQPSSHRMNINKKSPNMYKPYRC